MKHHIQVTFLYLLTILLVFSGCHSDEKQPSAEIQEASFSESQESSISAEDEALPTDTGEEAAVEATIEAAPAESQEATPEATATESTEAAAEAAQETSLKGLFEQHGMKIGLCLTPKMIQTKQINGTILEQFNSVTMENAMKPDYIFNQKKSKETGTLVVEFNNDMIKMLDWAKENNMAVRGHTLVWYSQTPGWIFRENFDYGGAFVSRDTMLQRLDSYIKQVFDKLTEGGYIDLIYAYDVVNEAWMEDGSMRSCDWLNTIGQDYIWQAFSIANKYAPAHIDLYYNDYNEQYKTDTYLKFVKTLMDENGNYLLDGIGLQAHLYTMDSLEDYFNTIDRLAATGLKLSITELDVCLGAWQNTLKASDENLRLQGQFYYNLVNGIFERVDAGTLKMDSFTIWGFSDNMSWRKEANPLIFNRNYMPKYAYYGVLQIKEKAGF